MINNVKQRALFAPRPPMTSSPASSDLSGHGELGMPLLYLAYKLCQNVKGKLLFYCSYLNGNHQMKDLFFFNAMLTPKIITIVYWVLLVGVLIGSLFTMYGGSFLAGLGSLIGGAIGTRMFCEMMIVLFKIHENLQKIANSK